MTHAANRDSACHGHRTGVADAQLPCCDAPFGCSFLSTPGEADLWRPAPGTVDDNVCEPDASPEPCSHSFQDSFLRGKPARQPFNSARPIPHLVDFFLNEAARDQRIAPILDPTSQLGNVNKINSVSNDDHCRCPFSNIVVRTSYLFICRELHMLAFEAHRGSRPTTKTLGTKRIRHDHT